MMTTNGGGSRVAHVHDEVKAGILTGRFRPGEALRPAVLAEQYGVSQSLVREALVRLTEQHLIVLAPNQGFRVIEASRDDLLAITDLRVLLEREALVRSIERGGVEWEAGIVSAHHVLARTPARSDGDVGVTAEWVAAHAAFHDALGAGCGNPRLATLARSLRESSEIYRELSGAGAAPKRDVAAEHRELMELATARDADAAGAAIERHIRTTAENLLASAFAEVGP